MTPPGSCLTWRPWRGDVGHVMWAAHAWPAYAAAPGRGVSPDPTLLCLTGVSAALVFQQEVQAPSTPLRVVFDGDAVLFSNETDQIFQEQGLEGAVQYERAMEAIPIGEVSIPPRFHGIHRPCPSLLLGFGMSSQKSRNPYIFPMHSVPGVGLIWSLTGNGSVLSYK